MTFWDRIGERITAASGETFTVARSEAVGGGCINEAYVVEGGGRRYFVKLNRADKSHMFETEAEGLAELAGAGTVRVPAPVCWGVEETSAFLVLEHLELGGRDGKAAERLGRELAQLHRLERPYYGWRMDNTIGATPQPNGPMDDWVGFFRERRLRFQLELAARNGFGGRLRREGERLAERLDAFFPGGAPAPSLLHGDLWSGNYAVDASGAPVLFDPAVYYGDREADVAMTELFGGFPLRFHAAYREAWPLAEGYGARRTLYNLYHVLNHLNLFGGGYLGQAEGMIGRLLSEIS